MTRCAPLDGGTSHRAVARLGWMALPEGSARILVRVTTANAIACAMGTSSR